MTKKHVNTDKIVLQYLENKLGEWLSGQDLADALQVTRNTVWRSINRLKAKGFMIETQTGLGYRLQASQDVLSAEKIQMYLEHSDKYNIQVFQSLDSTNQLLKEKARNGAKSGTVLIANSQMSGRGRLGREFFSPADSGVYFSFLMRPRHHFDLVQTSPALAAVALANTLDSLLNVQTEIKWVNDIYLNGKKIAGILSEGELDLENNQIKYLVIGIGINVYQPHSKFPAEFRERADYLIKDGIKQNLRNKIVATFLNQWDYYANQNHYQEAVRQFRNKNFLQNKKVEVFYQNKKIEGTVKDIDEQFELVLEDENQKQYILNHGEATLHQKHV